MPETGPCWTMKTYVYICSTLPINHSLNYSSCRTFYYPIRPVVRTIAISVMQYPDLPYEFMNSSIEELVKKVTNKSVVAYLGNGASIAAGADRWEVLMEEIVDLLEKIPEVKGQLRSITTLFKEGSLPLCAELIEILERPEVKNHIVERYKANGLKATSLHNEVSRIPFSFVFSTNYDGLIESVYPKTVPTLTWRDGNKLLENLKENEFSIVNMHGSASDRESIILTKSEFYKSKQKQVLQEALNYLFSYKTALFIGSSLKDPNLQRLLKHSRLLQGDDHFGPHYAIMFEDEVDRLYCKYLWEDYKIAVILCKCDVPKPSREWRTNVVSSILKEVSGKTAIYAYEHNKSPNLISSDFFLKKAAGNILKDVLERTGSNCGYIAYSKDINMHQLDLCVANMKKEQAYEPVAEDEPLYRKIQQLLGPASPLSRLFLQSHNRRDPYYIKDVRYPQKDWLDGIELNYDPVDKEVRSVMICPVRSDGKTVGLLLIDSHNVDTYTSDHERAVEAAADIAGAAYAEYQHRETASRGITPYLEWGEDFFALMNKNRDLAQLKMSYILYEVDYMEGTLKAHFDGELYPPGPDVKLFEYSFLSDSLTARTLKEQGDIFIEDVVKELALEKPRLARLGVKRFDIKGAVYSLPIRVEGRISAILVAWSQTGDKRLKKFRHRINRLSHFIVNDPDRDEQPNLDARCSHRFLERLNQKSSCF